MKCITHGCTNCSERPPMGNDHLKGPIEGRAICVEPDDDGWICEPCWIFLTKSTGRLNQIYKNALEVLHQRQSDQNHYYAGQAASLYGSELDLRPDDEDLIRRLETGRVLGN